MCAAAAGLIRGVLRMNSAISASRSALMVRRSPQVGLRQCPLERNGQMSGHTTNPFPSLVPLPVQTGAKARGFSPTAPEFTAETDSALEGDGFEPSVPRHGELMKFA